MRVAIIAVVALGALAGGCWAASEQSSVEEDAGGSDADSDADADADADGDTDTDTDIDTDAIPVEDCTGLPDFTACAAITDPDRSWDICIRGECRSPGCGTADCNAPGPHFPLADTGQRQCFNETYIVLDCPQPGESCFGQDAQYGWDAAHDADERFTLPDLSAAEPVVIDNVTGLAWQGCAAGLSGAQCVAGAALELSWTDALAWCDDLAWNGCADWHLPDEYELMSIADRDTSGPSIDAAAFPGTPTGWYWTSATSASHPDQAWYVSFSNGIVASDGKEALRKVRCVRAAPGPQPARFEVASPEDGQPVVRDAVTGLDWQGCAAGWHGDDCAAGELDVRDWSGALACCQDLSWGGHDDWRLPSATELRSILDDRAPAPSIDAAAFPNTFAGSFWSSTSLLGVVGPYAATAVNFGNSTSSQGQVTKDSGGAVRCVRGGAWDF